MKILVSGGHLTPALSFIDFVKTQHKDEVVFVGRKFTQTRLQQKSVEREQVEKRQIPFIQFDSGKIDLNQPLGLPLQFLKLCSSFFRAQGIVSKQKPDVFVSFGGYLAFPLALAAYFRGIPVITHEQTAAPGMANRVIAKFAQKVAISFAETASFFPKQKVVLTGNPVRHQLWEGKTSKPEWVMKSSQRPLLYITGGSQGSQAINNVIELLLPYLLPEWDIIHQCGKPNALLNYARDLNAAKEKLPAELQSRYVIREEWIAEEELAWIYQHAWAMISRSGANTVQEVIIANIPTIFVPLASAHHDEQTKNAQSLVQKGAGLLLAQKDLDEAHLLDQLNTLKKNHQSLVENLQKIAQETTRNADQLLYQVVLDTAHAQ